MLQGRRAAGSTDGSATAGTRTSRATCRTSRRLQHAEAAAPLQQGVPCHHHHPAAHLKKGGLQWQYSPKHSPRPAGRKPGRAGLQCSAARSAADALQRSWLRMQTDIQRTDHMCGARSRGLAAFWRAASNGPAIAALTLAVIVAHRLMDLAFAALQRSGATECKQLENVKKAVGASATAHTPSHLSMSSVQHSASHLVATVAAALRRGALWLVAEPHAVPAASWAAAAGRACGSQQ